MLNDYHTDSKQMYNIEMTALLYILRLQLYLRGSPEVVAHDRRQLITLTISACWTLPARLAS